jgi:ATP-dependent DNA helicase HFM1/MER3
MAVLPKDLVKERIPSAVQNVFPFKQFNEMQTALIHQSLETDENMVIAAPSGSGKTVILELAICREFLQHGNSSLKCIYIAPNKALCQQRFFDWNLKFSTLGLRVLEVTGDSDIHNCLLEISRSAIIITTPEKWDCVTRCWRNHAFILCGTNLLLIDEIHHLADGDRGAVLESVIVRMMHVDETKNHNTDNK